MTTTTTSFKITSTFKQVSSLVQEIKQIAINAGMNIVESDRFELGLAEAFNNVVKHAYQMQSNHKINVTVTHEDNQLTVEILDTGIPMTTGLLGPSRNYIAIENGSLEDIPDGGWGIELIRDTMDSSLYIHSERGVNRMILVKKLSG